MKLVVISNLEHYASGGVFVCSPPAAVREVDALAALFDQVEHLACLRPGEAPASAEPYRASNVRLALLPSAGGRGVAGKLDALRALPGRIRALQKAWGDADAALVRCPSNVAAAALLALSCGLGPRRVWVKYTGPWQGRAGEALGYRVQRLWLRVLTGRVTITTGGVEADPGYGAITLCNPSLSLAVAREAERATRGKALSTPWRLLAVGRLASDKSLDIALRALVLLRIRGHEATFDIAGDGPERLTLAALAASLGVEAHVRFHGWLNERDLDELYRNAHLLLAPSRAEGWSRAWTEAAARRCVPLAAKTGAATGLARSGAGHVLASYDPQAWADQISRLLEDEPVWRTCAEKGPRLAREFTYERFADGARAVLQLPVGEPERILSRA
ncbi:MAG: glycosyltransferase [Bryobacterales bacterium]